MLPRRSLHAGGTEPQGLPAGSDLDHRRAGLEAAGKLAPEGEQSAIKAPPDLLEGHAAEHHLRRPRDDAERVRPREQPPEDDSRDPVVLADHVPGIHDCRPVVDDRSAQIQLPGPVGSALQDPIIEQVRSVPIEKQQSYDLVLQLASTSMKFSRLAVATSARRANTSSAGDGGRFQVGLDGCLNSTYLEQSRPLRFRPSIPGAARHQETCHVLSGYEMFGWLVPNCGSSQPHCRRLGA